MSLFPGSSSENRDYRLHGLYLKYVGLDMAQISPCFAGSEVVTYAWWDTFGDGTSALAYKIHLWLLRQRQSFQVFSVHGYTDCILSLEVRWGIFHLCSMGFRSGALSDFQPLGWGAQCTWNTFTIALCAKWWRRRKQLVTERDRRTSGLSSFC